MKSLVPSVYPLGHVGNEFSKHQESFGAVESQAGGSVLDTGVTLTVISHVRGRRPQVVLNRLDAKAW